MHRALLHFLTAAGFLTRLAPARGVQPEEMGFSLRLFPLVGLAMGLVLTIPWFLGLLGQHPWIQALLWLAGALWMTRGLHWDGWVDLWDAWGSGARDEHFWEVLKDSRMGAFGGMGLFMGLAGCLILLHNVFQQQDWGLLVWTPVLGRAAAPVLAWMGRDLQRPGLAGIFLNAASNRCLVITTIQAVLLGLLFIPAKTMLLAGAFLLGGLLFLARLAKNNTGMNGDFLGSAIIWGEISALLAGAL